MSTARSRAEITIEARDKASRELGQINNETQALTGNVERMGKAMMVAGAAITAVLTKALMDFVRVGDEMHKMAIRTGLTTKELGELGFMAELAGGSLGTVERTLRRLQGGLFRAGTLSAEVTDELNALGVTIGELQKLSPEEQFHRLMEALAGVETHSQRAAAAQALFGRAGTMLLPMIDKGIEGYKKSREEAAKFAYVTEQMTQISADFKDEQLRLRMAIMGTSAAMIQHLVPHVLAGIKSIRELVMITRGWLEENQGVSASIVRLVAVTGVLLTATGAMLTMWKKFLIPAMKTIILNLKAMFVWKSALLWKIMLVVAAWELLVRGIAGLLRFIPGMGKVSDKILEWATISGLAKKGMDGLTGAIREAADGLDMPEVDQAAEDFDGLAESINGVTDAADEMKKHTIGIDKMLTPMLELGRKVQHGVGLIAPAPGSDKPEIIQVVVQVGSVDEIPDAVMSVMAARA